MSILENEIIIENLLDRAEPFFKHVPSAELDLGQYLANNDWEGAEQFVQRLENSVPMMLEGRDDQS